MEAATALSSAVERVTSLSSSHADDDDANADADGDDSAEFVLDEHVADSAVDSSVVEAMLKATSAVEDAAAQARAAGAVQESDLASDESCG